jgi:predicted cation transporter
MITIVLLVIFLLILVLPIFVKPVEHNLELFLLVVGTLTVMLSHLMGPEPLLTKRLVESAFFAPIKLTIATLVFGLAFRAIREPMKKKIVTIEDRLGPRFFAFLLIFSLGLLSSVITAIIAALVLCEVVSAISLDKKYETRLVVFACFSIGMGAALTPIGMPLSAIAAAKLSGGVFDNDFLMMMRTYGIYILPGLVVISFVGSLSGGAQVARSECLTEDFVEPFQHIALRAFKVFVFVMALILLGEGFKPLVDLYIVKMPAPALYWVNIVSAILDNATLAAAELGPLMSAAQVKGIIMGLIISGGILIPGNIPNIIAANKLSISSRAWAAIGVPFGLGLMAVYFGILYF